MDYRQQNTAKGEVSEVVFGPGESLSDYRTFFDALMEAPTNTVVVRREKITEAFFDLKTGLAGDILQKVSNYRKRLVLLGDFANVESKSLRDFIRESNRTGQVVFAPTLEAAVELLR